MEGSVSLWGLLTEASPASAARAVLITCGGIHGDLAGPCRRTRGRTDVPADDARLPTPPSGDPLSATAGLFNDLAQRLATRGVATLQLTYRHCLQENLAGCQDDATHAVRWACRRWPAAAVLLLGYSMGGAVALAAACAESAHVRGVATLAGQLSGVRYSLREAGPRREAASFTIGNG
jgi:alpha/beta superfamily hydrolase